MSEAESWKLIGEDPCDISGKRKVFNSINGFYFPSFYFTKVTMPSLLSSDY